MGRRAADRHALMRHSIPLSVLALLAGGCQRRTTALHPARPGENGFPQASWVPIYFWTFDNVAAAAQLRRAAESARIAGIARSLNAIDSLLRTPDSERVNRAGWLAPGS